MNGLLLALAVFLVPPQEGLRIEVGIRPGAVRAGGTAVMTVRVVSDRGGVEGVEFVPPPGVELADVQERRSVHVTPQGGQGQVVEADFHLVGVEVGRHALPPVLVYVNGRAVQAEAPTLSVSPAPLEWATPRSRAREQARREDGTSRAVERRVQHEGVPPAEGELRSAVSPSVAPGWEGGLYPGSAGQGSGAYWNSYPGQYPQAVPSDPWASPYGWGMTPWGDPHGMPGNPMTMPGYSTPTPPMAGGGWGGGTGAGWAATARSDPWWPELVPELLRYQTVAGDPEGVVELSVGMTPDAVYVGQQLTYVATASFAPGAQLRLGGDPHYVPPHPEGFWVVDLPQAGEGTPAASRGQVRQTYTFKRALFPLEAGSFLIPPARVDSVVATESLPVTVLPIPADRAPTGYSGAVGRYRLEAFLTPTRVAVGETAILTVRIVGAGNVRMLPSPEPALFADVELAPYSDWALPEVVDGVVGGVKTFNWMVVPLSPGTIRMGPILYPYFDPYLGAFGMAESGELELEVTELPGAGRRRP